MEFEKQFLGIIVYSFKYPQRIANSSSLVSKPRFDG